MSLGGWFKLGVVQIWPFISDKRIQLLSETRLYEPRGLSQRGPPVSQQCSIHQDFVVTLYTPGACVRWSESDHNAGKLSVVLGTIYGTLWLWCGQFEVGLLQLLQLLSGVGISWEVLALVSQDTYLYHVEIHPIWFERPVWWRSLLVVSNLHNGQLSAVKSWLTHGKKYLLCHTYKPTLISKYIFKIVDQHTGGMWLIDGTKHRNYNQ